MKIEKMESMSVGKGVGKDSYGAINPFTQDCYHMGSFVGSNAAIMQSNFDHLHCPYLIVIDRITGERIKIVF